MIVCVISLLPSIIMYNYRLDTTLLAEVFTRFRRTAISIFSIDPARFISLPQYAFSCMLKVTDARLELISKPDMLDFVERTIKGGFSFVSHRYYKKSEVPDKNGHITSAYLIDANNLYGAQSCRSLPVKDFTWLNREEIDAIDWTCTEEGTQFGYLVEADLSFPDNIHRTLNSFVPLPENRTIPESMLSEYARTAYYAMRGDTSFVPETKLIATLEPRKKYRLHYVALRTYLALGVKLDRVTRVLRKEV